MKTKLILGAGVAAALLAAGCASFPPGAERGPHGTMAFNVSVDASAPGAVIEVNGNMVGKTPMQLKIFGNPDGMFHDFGSYYYIIRAYPVATNQFQQIKVFWTGRNGTHRDAIPQHIYFDMNQDVPVVLPPEPPPQVYYPPPPPFYYGPPPYPFYYGPEFRFYYRR